MESSGKWAPDTQSSVLSGAYCLAQRCHHVGQRRAGGDQSCFLSPQSYFPGVSKMFPCNTKNLAIPNPYRWKHPASKPLVFPSVSMADEKRISNGTHITPPHGNTQPSVSTMFRKSFHGPEKVNDDVLLRLIGEGNSPDRHGCCSSFCR